MNPKVTNSDFRERIEATKKSDIMNPKVTTKTKPRKIEYGATYA